MPLVTNCVNCPLLSAPFYQYYFLLPFSNCVILCHRKSLSYLLRIEAALCNNVTFFFIPPQCNALAQGRWWREQVHNAPKFHNHELYAPYRIIVLVFKSIKMSFLYKFVWEMWPFYTKVFASLKYQYLLYSIAKRYIFQLIIYQPHALWNFIEYQCNQFPLFKNIKV